MSPTTQPSSWLSRSSSRAPSSAVHCAPYVRTMHRTDDAARRVPVSAVHCDPHARTMHRDHELPPRIGTRTPRSTATASASSYPASTCLITPVAGSLVSTRSSFCAASGVPSATHTCPAWIDRPMPTPPPWWTLTQVAPEAALTSAFRIGQSAIASEPSAIAPLARHRVRAVGHPLGFPVRRGDRTAVQVVPAEHDRRPHRPARDQIVEPQASEVPFAVAEPAYPGGQALEVQD